MKSENEETEVSNKEIQQALEKLNFHVDLLKISQKALTISQKALTKQVLEILKVIEGANRNTDLHDWKVIDRSTFYDHWQCTQCLEDVELHVEDKEMWRAQQKYVKCPVLSSQQKSE